MHNGMITNMKRDEVLRRLQAEQREMASLGVKSLALFGSVARDEAGSASDLDFLVEFQGPATFRQYMKLKLFLEELFGGPIDLVTKNGIRPQILPYIEQDALYVS